MTVAKTSIEWTEATWSIVRGCRRVSPGCENCYAEGIAARFSGEGLAYEGLANMTPAGPRWTGEVRLIESELELPFRWRRPRRVFVCSMSDLFHKDVPNEYIARAWDVMLRCPQHTFQVLTKRPERMLEWFVTHRHELPRMVLDNVWLGTSVEDQSTADLRIPYLLRCPAKIRWVSYEPALGPVDFAKARALTPHNPNAPVWPPTIDWLVVGGESGAGARPFDLQWARDVINQCKGTQTRVFVKQLGSRPVHYSLGSMSSLRVRGKGGDMSEWPEDLRIRQYPEPVSA